MNLFRKAEPIKRRLTDAEKAKSAAQYLARHRITEVARKSAVTIALEHFVAAGGCVPITPRDQNVADIRRTSR